MSNIANFKCRQATAGAEIVIIIDGTVSCPRQMQFNCISGTISAEGESGDLFGVAGLTPTAIVANAGQSINFNEGQYNYVKITIAIGTVYQIILNQ